MSGKPVRLVISDVDGTLVRHDKSLSDANVAAIARLRAAGIAVSLISARPPSGMHWIVERLGLAGPFGAFNGGTLFMADGSVTHAERLDEQLSHAIVAMIDRAGIDSWVFAAGKWFARTTQNSHLPRERLSAGIDPVLCDDPAAIAGATDKIVAVSDDFPVVARLEQAACESFGATATIKRSQPYYLDFTAPGANKGAGIAGIAQAMGVPLDQVAVIGDGPNDLAMFARAGTSIAMGNAEDEVRAAADWETASNEEDGVAAAIDRLLQA